MKLDTLMHWLTAAIFAAFIGFGYLWYSGSVQGNFSALLLAICLVTGLYWIAERLYFLPRRRAAAERFAAEHSAKSESFAKQGLRTDNLDVAAVQSQLVMQPWWLDWTAGLFPVIAVVFLFRSFLWEPFKIPSGSMIPTLYIGDLILVNKFTYGLKVPVFHQRLTPGNAVARGDVVVFRYPPQPHLDYIKRVVGLPGDEISYINKQIKINGQDVTKTQVEKFFDPDTLTYADQFEEKLGERPMRLLNFNSAPGVSPIFDEIPHKNNCTWSIEGVVCKVPQGHYFVMGDNRDNSQDSRYWGFVPEGNIVGKATAIWMNFSHFDRIFTKVQ